MTSRRKPAGIVDEDDGEEDDSEVRLPKRSETTEAKQSETTEAKRSETTSEVKLQRHWRDVDEEDGDETYSEVRAPRHPREVVDRDDKHDEKRPRFTPQFRCYLVQRRTAILLLTCAASYFIFRWKRLHKHAVAQDEAVVTPQAFVNSSADLGCDPPPLEHAAPIFQRYCNVDAASGFEGKLPPDADKKLQLRAVVLTIRHGDRSNLERISASGYDGYFDCSPGNLDKVWEDLPHRFRIVSAATGLPLTRRFTPEVGPDGKECKRGQLTARGFRQHLSLGRHLRSSYKEFVRNLPRNPTPASFYVRSTDYPRTIGSAAALLTAMMRPESIPGGLQIPISVFDDDTNEMMLGYGRKSGTSGFDKDQCPAIARYAKQQQDAYKKPEMEYAKLRKIFGEEEADKDVCAFSDSIYAVTCHGLMRPWGPGGCIEEPLAQSIIQHADDFFCKRFVGKQGGARASQLAMFPFMQEILSRLEKAAAVTNGVPSFSMYAGHDTVISPVLSALGVYRGKYCRWPGYASRVAFELYSKRGFAKAEEQYLRVVFNGEAMLGVLGCEASQAELCPLMNFTHGLSMLLGRHSLTAACQENSPPPS